MEPRNQRSSPTPPGAFRLLNRPLVLVTLAVALTALVAWQGHSVQRRLPAQQGLLLDEAALQRSYQRLVNDVNRPAACGHLYTQAFRDHDQKLHISAFQQFRRAWQNPDELGELRMASDLLAQQPTLSLLPRLGQAGAALMRLQYDGTPPENWWKSIEPYLKGLENAKFAHYQGARRQALATANTEAGMQRGSAWELADRVVDPPFGAMLQIIAPLLDRAADGALRAGDATGAATCRRVLGRLLKDWIIEPGPPGLRLLAAEMLAERVSPIADSTQPAGASARLVADPVLARDLRAWVAEYRKRRAVAPTTMLSINPNPALATPDYDNMVGYLAGATVLGGALLSSGLVALLCVMIGLRALRSTPVATVDRLGHILVWGAALAFALIVVQEGAAGQADWFRTGENSEAGSKAAIVTAWARLPFYGAAIPVLPLALATAFAGKKSASTTLAGRGSRLARLGRTAICGWLILAALTGAFFSLADAARGRYEAAVAEAYSRGEIESTLGANHDRLMASLRAWEPR